MEGPRPNPVDIGVAARPHEWQPTPEAHENMQPVVNTYLAAFELFDGVPALKLSPREQADREFVGRRIDATLRQGRTFTVAEIPCADGTVVRKRDYPPVNEITSFLEKRLTDKTLSAKELEQTHTYLQILYKNSRPESLSQEEKAFAMAAIHQRERERLEADSRYNNPDGTPLRKEDVARVLSERRALVLPLSQEDVENPILPTPATPPPAPDTEDNEHPVDDPDDTLVMGAPASPVERAKIRVAILHRTSEANKKAYEEASIKVREEAQKEGNKYNPLHWLRKAHYKLAEQYYRQSYAERLTKAKLKSGSSFATMMMGRKAAVAADAFRAQFDQSGQDKAVAVKARIEQTDGVALPDTAVASEATTKLITKEIILPVYEQIKLGQRVTDKDVHGLLQTFMETKLDKGTDISDESRAELAKFFALDKSLTFGAKERLFATDIIGMAQLIHSDVVAKRYAEERIQEDVEIILSNPTWGAATEANLGIVDRAVKLAQSGRGVTGVILNPTVIGAAASLASIGLGKAIGITNSSLSYIVPGVGIFTGGALAAVRNGYENKLDMADHKRDRAYGETSDDKAKKRAEFDKFSFDVVNVATLINGGGDELIRGEGEIGKRIGINALMDMLDDPGKSPAAQIMIARRLGEIYTRLDYRDNQKRDLITFHGRYGGVEEGEKQLLTATAALRAKLRSKGLDLTEKIIDSRRAWAERFKTNIEDQERDFNRYRLKSALKTGVKAGLVGAATLGIIKVGKPIVEDAIPEVKALGRYLARTQVAQNTASGLKELSDLTGITKGVNTLSDELQRVVKNGSEKIDQLKSTVKNIPGSARVRRVIDETREAITNKVERLNYSQKEIVRSLYEDPTQELKISPNYSMVVDHEIKRADTPFAHREVNFIDSKGKLVEMEGLRLTPEGNLRYIGDKVDLPKEITDYLKQETVQEYKQFIPWEGDKLYRDGGAYYLGENILVETDFANGSPTIRLVDTNTALFIDTPPLKLQYDGRLILDGSIEDLPANVRKLMEDNGWKITGGQNLSEINIDKTRYFAEHYIELGGKIEVSNTVDIALDPEAEKHLNKLDNAIRLVGENGKPIDPHPGWINKDGSFILAGQPADLSPEAYSAIKDMQVVETTEHNLRHHMKLLAGSGPDEAPDQVIKQGSVVLNTHDLHTEHLNQGIAGNGQPYKMEYDEMAQKYNRIDPFTNQVEVGKMSFTFRPEADNIMVNGFLQGDGTFHVNPDFMVNSNYLGNDPITNEKWSKITTTMAQEGWDINEDKSHYIFTPPTATLYTPKTLTTFLPGVTERGFDLIPSDEKPFDAINTFSPFIVEAPRNHLEKTAPGVAGAAITLPAAPPNVGPEGPRRPVVQIVPFRRLGRSRLRLLRPDRVGRAERAQLRSDINDSLVRLGEENRNRTGGWRLRAARGTANLGARAFNAGLRRVGIETRRPSEVRAEAAARAATRPLSRSPRPAYNPYDSDPSVQPPIRSRRAQNPATPANTLPLPGSAVDRDPNAGSTPRYTRPNTTLPLGYSPDIDPDDDPNAAAFNLFNNPSAPPPSTTPLPDIEPVSVDASAPLPRVATFERPDRELPLSPREQELVLTERLDPIIEMAHEKWASRVSTEEWIAFNSLSAEEKLDWVREKIRSDGAGIPSHILDRLSFIDIREYLAPGHIRQIPPSSIEIENATKVISADPTAPYLISASNRALNPYSVQSNLLINNNAEVVGKYAGFIGVFEGQGGNIASTIASEEFGSSLGLLSSNPTRAQVEGALLAGYDAAQARLKLHRKEYPSPFLDDISSATVVQQLVIDGQRHAAILNIGNNRAYYMTNSGEVRQINTHESAIQLDLSYGAITPHEAALYASILEESADEESYLQSVRREGLDENRNYFTSQQYSITGIGDHNDQEPVITYVPLPDDVQYVFTTSGGVHLNLRLSEIQSVLSEVNSVDDIPALLTEEAQKHVLLPYKTRDGQLGYRQPEITGRNYTKDITVVAMELRGGNGGSHGPLTGPAPSTP